MVPYYHGKEIMDPKGPYKKWHPLSEHQDKLDALMADLIKIIGQSGLRGFMSIVRIPDLDHFNAEKGLRLEPYPMAAYGCMLAISQEYSFEPMEQFFDHVEKVDLKLAAARVYADTDEHYRDENLGRILLNPLAEYYNFKRVVELQAADFIAGDFRKNHLVVDEWFQIDGKPEDQDERHVHFEEWALQKFGTRTPALRKSLEVAIYRTTHVPFVWDYDRLCEAHRVRGEKWA